MRNFIACSLVLLAAACGGDDGADIDSNEEARRAYLGLDGSIGASLTLGFAGFNAANSANIDPQTAPGPALGTLTISGQVDQGSSDNKNMRLYVGMVEYSEGPIVVVVDDEEQMINITYDTDAETTTQPYLELQLRDVPTGTLTGTLKGVYHMTGDLEGDVTLDLSFSGMLQGTSQQDVTRVPGSTTVTGTATSGDGLYDVNLTL